MERGPRGTPLHFAMTVQVYVSFVIKGTWGWVLVWLPWWCPCCRRTAFLFLSPSLYFCPPSTCMYTYMHLHVHLHEPTCTYMYTYMNLHASTCTPTWTYMHLHVHLHEPTCTYMYTYMYTYMHLHIHLHAPTCTLWC